MSRTDTSIGSCDVCAGPGPRGSVRSEECTTLASDARAMDDEEWTTCPYDRAHRVPRLRIQAHLVKCERRHPPLAVCPYNATHRMPEAQLAAHAAACPAAPAPPPAHRPRAALYVPRRRAPRAAPLAAPRDPADEQWDD